MEPGQKVKAIRLALGFTQDELAEKAGFGRGEVVKIEGGTNAATSWRIRSGLAKAFRVTAASVADLLDGKITADELLSRARAGEIDTPRGSRLSQRPEWGSATQAARAIARETDPNLPETAWDAAGQLYDTPVIPNPLTPRVILHLVRAMSSV